MKKWYPLAIMPEQYIRGIKEMINKQTEIA